MSEVVVLSLGQAGVLLVSAAGCLRLRAPTVRVASKVGAGDSTVAGIVWSLAQGASVRDATLFGVATGAAAVMTDGTGLSRRADVEQLYERLVAESAILTCHRMTWWSVPVAHCKPPAVRMWR